MLADGDTARCPGDHAGTLPIPWFIEQPVAPDTLHDSMEDPPGAMLVGDAAKLIWIGSDSNCADAVNGRKNKMLAANTPPAQSAAEREEKYVVILKELDGSQRMCR